MAVECSFSSCVALSVIFAAKAEAAIVADPFAENFGANDSVDSGFTYASYPTSVPSSVSFTVIDQLCATQSVAFASNYSGTSLQASALMTADPNANAAPDDYAGGQCVWQSYFTVDQTTPYWISGSAQIASCTPGENPPMFLGAQLWELTDEFNEVLLYASYQHSSDGSTITLAPQTGILQAGSHYFWTGQISSADSESSGDLYTFAGAAELSIASPVPEPTALIIWSLLGTLAVGLGWRRKRDTAADG